MPRIFSVEIYEDLLTEAAWLYEQRLRFFDKPNYLWTDFQPYEIRLMNFLDSLIHRDETVDTFCQKNAFNGELFTAVYVLVKRKGLKAINLLISDMDFTDPAMKNAFIEAVKYVKKYGTFRLERISKFA